MADNVVLNTGTGGATLASDDIGGVQHQRVKIEYGVDGVATDVSDTNPLPIDDAGGSLTVDGTVTANAGTGTMAVSAASLPLPAGAATAAGQLADGHNVAAAGDVANDGVDSGNPVKVGAVAEATEQTAVADGDRTNLIATLNGKLVTSPYAVPERHTSGATAAITGTVNTAVIAAPGAGVRLYITSILVTNSHATVGTVVEVKDGTAVLYRGYARQDGGGWSHTLPVPLRLTANTAFNAANVTTGSNTYVSAAGYIAP